MEDLEALKKEASETPAVADSEYEYASTFGTQVKIVCERAFVQVILAPFEPSSLSSSDVALPRHRICHEQVPTTHQ